MITEEFESMNVNERKQYIHDNEIVQTMIMEDLDEQESKELKEIYDDMVADQFISEMKEY